MATGVKLKRLVVLCGRAALVVVLVALGLARSVWACPICGEPTITLTERLARADVALLVEWVSSRPAKAGEPESTTYEIVQVHRDATSKFKSGETVSVNQLTGGKPGDLFLLMGQKDEQAGVKWEVRPPLAVSETGYQYVIQAPPPETPAEKRLGYFIKFLEFPDLTIANDAFAEFVNAPTKDIYAVASKLPREKLRKWLADPKTPVTRRSGYGLMLGMSGNADDARFLEKQITEATEEESLGLAGVTFGYLLLAGEKGLATLERTHLANQEISDGEVYTVVLALRYFWSYGNGTIAPAKLQAAMRLLLDRPALAESAIVDLARWKDWSLQARLMGIYKDEDRADRKLKEAIIHYMIACTKDVPKGAKEPPAHVAQAQTHLAELRELDPKLVASGEKNFYTR